MKRNFLLATLLLAVSGTISVPLASAQAFPQAAATPAQDEATPWGSGLAARLIEHRLGLTDTQRAELKTIVQQERPTLQQLAATLSKEHEELLALTTFDEQKTLAIAAKYSDANTSALVEREKLRDEIYAILTPEQQTKVQQFRARFGTLLERRLETLGDNL